MKISRHINLEKTHRLLFRLYGYKAIVATLSGVGILFVPQLFIGSSNYTVIFSVLPVWLIGALWLACGVLIGAGIFKLSYKVARIGISISIILYFLWGTGLLTNQLVNQILPTSLFAVLAYYSLAISSFLMLLEPPINPETAIRTKEK